MTSRRPVAALDDVAEFERRMAELRRGRAYLQREFERMRGLSVIAGDGNFVLLDVAKTQVAAQAIVDAMLIEGVYIRLLAVHHAKRSFVRVTVGTDEQNRKCVEAMRKVLSTLGRFAPEAANHERFSQGEP